MSISESRPSATPSDKPAARRPRAKTGSDIDPYLVARVDQMAKASGVSRNAALALGVSWLIRRLRESDAHWNG